MTTASTVRIHGVRSLNVTAQSGGPTDIWKHRPVSPLGHGTCRIADFSIGAFPTIQVDPTYVPATITRPTTRMRATRLFLFTQLTPPLCLIPRRQTTEWRIRGRKELRKPFVTDSSIRSSLPPPFGTSYHCAPPRRSGQHWKAARSKQASRESQKASRLCRSFMI
jgi:hypothetical protein